MFSIFYPYREFDNIHDLPLQFEMGDHLGGFDENLGNTLFSNLQNHAQSNDLEYKITLYQVVTSQLKEKYPNLTLLSDFQAHDYWNFKHFHNYHVHPEKSYDHFVCSFNGSPHVGRKLLVAILHRFGWYHPDQISKNFAFDTDVVDGHLGDYLDLEQQRFYRKFFIGDDSENFFKTVNSFGHVRFEHATNIYNLENKLTSSFLHIISETLATSYYPYVTEKFLYSIVTRGLFLAYAQPNWHVHLEKYYGFKRYTKLFDYRFDSMQNPIQRLVELITMISKFQNLTVADWHDLYLLEQDTIEYNYHHYFSGNYLGQLHQYKN